jgi:hypothetical protein
VYYCTYVQFDAQRWTKRRRAKTRKDPQQRHHTIPQAKPKHSRGGKKRNKHPQIATTNDTRYSTSQSQPDGRHVRQNPTKGRWWMKCRIQLRWMGRVLLQHPKVYHHQMSFLPHLRPVLRDWHNHYEKYNELKIDTTHFYNTLASSVPGIGNGFAKSVNWTEENHFSWQY